MLTTRSLVAGAALAAAATTIDISPAAADWAITGSCVGHWGMGSCVLTKNGNPRDPHVRHIDDRGRSDAETRESQERDKKWMAYCKPVSVTDRYGVVRYQYAREGCDFGRSQN